MQQTGETFLLNCIKWHLFPEKRDSIKFDSIAADEMDNIIISAQSHAVLPFVFDAFSDEEIGIKTDKKQKYSIVDKTRQTVFQNYRLFFTTKYVVGLLKENGIETVILKGIAAGENYPVWQYRKSGDIDLFLVDSKDLDKAIKVLKSKNYRYESDGQLANHHEVMISPEGIDIELHTLLVEPFAKEDINEKIKDFGENIKKYVVVKDIHGATFNTLEKGAFAFTLLMHALQHYLRAGFGLKLLTDLAVLFNSGLTKEETDTYLELIKDFKVEGFSEFMLSLCVYKLGIDEEKIPHKLSDANECNELFADIMAGEEFGRSSKDRMVVVENNSLGAYFKEFHHQMQLSFPKAGKVFIIFPILWTITLIRFLVNNKKVRNTSTRAIFSSAKKRSYIYENMEIFIR